jgi:hypothetical protein
VEVAILVGIDLVELQDETVKSIAREKDITRGLPHLSRYVVSARLKVIYCNFHLQLELILEMSHFLKLCKCFQLVLQFELGNC